MVEERRITRRARISGVRVIFESASGEPVTAQSLDLGRGGLFVETATPLGVGKRIALELHFVGAKEAEEPWVALGRVVWTRTTSEDESRPVGMGVRIIDADDTVLEALDRLVETRERTEPGTGDSAAPAVTQAGPAREETLVGVGETTTPAPEASIPIDLVEKQPGPPAETHVPPAESESTRPRRGGGRWVAWLSVVAVVAVAAYVLGEGIVRAPAPVRPIPPVIVSSIPVAPTVRAVPSVSTKPASGDDVRDRSTPPPLPTSSATPSASEPPIALPPASATTRIPPARTLRTSPRRTDNPY